jgi:hypothetical protein
VKIPGLTDAQRQQMQTPIAKASTVYREEAAKLGVAWPVAKPNVEAAIPMSDVLGHVSINSRTKLGNQRGEHPRERPTVRDEGLQGACET